MQRIYLAHSTLTSQPLRIAAPNPKAALEIYNVWSARMNGGEPPEGIKIELLSRNSLALEPQLHAVMGEGMQGICYWLGHRPGYAVAAPGEPFMGYVAPPPCKVRCFAVDHDGGEMLVFASTMDLAHGIYITRFEDAYLDGNDIFVEEISRWLLLGPMATLREDMDLGLNGIGSVFEDGFWRIFPANHEPTND